MYQGDNDWGVRVYICRSFTEVPDPVSYVHSFEPVDRDMLLPGFGAPLSFNYYVLQKPDWLIAKVIKFSMGGNAPVSLSRRVEVRAHTDTLPRSSTDTTELSRIKVFSRSLLTAISLICTTLLLRGAGTSAAGGAGSPYNAGDVGGPRHYPVRCGI